MATDAVDPVDTIIKTAKHEVKLTYAVFDAYRAALKTVNTALQQPGVTANVVPQHEPSPLIEARENMKRAEKNINTVNKEEATRVSTAESNFAAAESIYLAAQTSLKWVLQMKLQMLQPQQKSLHELEAVQQQQLQQQRDVADAAAVAELQAQIDAIDQ